MKDNIRRNQRGRREGNIVVLTAFLMIALMGLVAFAVDVGYIANAKTELQRSADAIALASAARLPDLTAALLAATETSANNQTPVTPALNPTDLVFGFWDRNAATFTSPPPLGRPFNAARVTLRRTQAAGDPLQLFFGRVLGSESSDVIATATAYSDHSLCGPFVGIDWLSVPGNPQTDSFDSYEGSYKAHLARDRGSLCSDGPISVEGSPVVRGDARAGRNDTVTIEGSAVVTGAIGSRVKPLELPPVDTSVVKLVNNNLLLPPIKKGNNFVSPLSANGDFTLDGTVKYDMPPGTYYFRNMTLSGQSTLNISGSTKIYITGNLYRGGGTYVNNNTQLANNLQLYMTGGTAKITSDNNFYGVLYAPNTAVELAGSADYFGAIVGKTLIATGSGCAHYDESLKLDGVVLPLRVCLVE
jgi:hypothetical protein